MLMYSKDLSPCIDYCMTANMCFMLAEYLLVVVLKFQLYFIQNMLDGSQTEKLMVEDLGQGNVL